MTVSRKGNSTINSISGGLNYEKDKNRIVGRDENNIPTLVISSVPGEESLVEITPNGVDVFTASDDEKVMSSKFNMYKIINSGQITLTPRNASITLSGTTIGYSFKATVVLDDTLTGIQGKPMVRVYTDTYARRDIRYAGSFYNDGTNKVSCNYTYGFQAVGGSATITKLVITFNFRLEAGSFSFNPYTYLNIPIYYEVCNQTRIADIGGGGAGTGDGKYYYLDTITYDKDGNITTALSSSLAEFQDGYSNHFPKVTSGLL